MPRSEPRGGLEGSKGTVYRVGVVGKLGANISETILEAAKKSIEDELRSMPESFKNVSNLAKMAISSIPGAKDNPIGAGLFTVLGFVTKNHEDISNDELLRNIKMEMRKMEDHIYEMFQARPYAELANALDLFAAFKSQGVHGDGLKWLKSAEDSMNINLRELMRLMSVNPGSTVALDMLSHVVSQGQIYMSVLDTLCSVDIDNAHGYAVKRKNFGTDIVESIRKYFHRWKECIPVYVERTGGYFFGLFGPYGYQIMFWNDWIGSYPHGQWTASMQASAGWDAKYASDPMSCPNLTNVIENFLGNRNDLFGDLKRLIATASMFEEWAK